MAYKSSPIRRADTSHVRAGQAQVRARQALYPTSLFGDQGDLMMIMLGCFLAFGLFIYYVMPSGTSHQYARVGAELNYHWSNLWYSFEYQFYTTYYPFVESLWQDLMVLLPR
jgi:hypothetical protein